MRYWGKVLSAAAAALAALALAAPGPAAAAGPAITLDDSRDGTQCPGALDVTDLSTLAPLASGQTLTLCSGEYTGQLTITSVSAVKVMGKADPAHGRPRIVPKPDMQGALIAVNNSAGVSISGITFDGASSADPATILWHDGASDISAIHIFNASVTITGNVIQRMRPPTALKAGNGILAEGATTAPRTITIASNSIFDFRLAGIDIEGDGDYTPTITKNLIAAQNVQGSDITAIQLVNIQRGSVSGNTIRGSWNYASNAGSSAAIIARESSNLKISTNQISLIGEGIHLSAGTMSGNTISGNTLTDVQHGITLLTGGFALVAMPGSSNNKVTGNKLTNHAGTTSVLGMGTTFAGIDVKLDAPLGAGNAVTGNSVLGFFDNAIFVNDTAHIAASGNKTGLAMPGK